MAEIRIEFACDNAAMVDDDGDIDAHAVRSVLRWLADGVSSFELANGDRRVILDYNGNTIGHMEVTR